MLDTPAVTLPRTPIPDPDLLEALRRLDPAAIDWHARRDESASLFSVLCANIRGDRLDLSGVSLVERARAIAEECAIEGGAWGRIPCLADPHRAAWYRLLARVVLTRSAWRRWVTVRLRSGNTYRGYLHRDARADRAGYVYVLTGTLSGLADGSDVIVGFACAAIVALEADPEERS